ncbi:DUF4231 domain-containing protein [Oculatella sp. LEGE 06141]|uniref:DUF4231 domain-containing protein n=1 Tax=Oculatella sp. LEGE 06141 TaxID=1828648 RepID=UPI00188115EA|nr:DUF4231 domain-containing protein [Oculatella sp. LEGE 06141]MBE9177804.1 DUF4231 domain-containing protein [Oculatella sp. LEGE 06141]
MVRWLGFNRKRERAQAYANGLKQDFNNLIDELKLEPLQTRFLKSRWLEQVLWMEGRAAYCRDRYYNLRLMTIIGGVLVPILVTLQADSATNINYFFRIGAIGLSGLVAVSSAVEEFFHYGERWYHYRRTVESLKAEGWQFFQLSGIYRPYAVQGHSAAFPLFSEQIEDIIRQDVDIYVNQMTREKKKEKSES